MYAQRPSGLIARVIGGIIRAVIVMGDKLTAFAEGPAGDALKGIVGVAGDVGGFLSDPLGSLPFRAGGGIIKGLGVVGEEGPEIARHTGGGTMITPLKRASGGAATLGGKIVVRSTVISVLDGKVVAENTADQVAEWGARRGK